MEAKKNSRNISAITRVVLTLPPVIWDAWSSSAFTLRSAKSTHQNLKPKLGLEAS